MTKFFDVISAFISRARDEEEGQTLVEYAFLIAFIALVVLVALQLLGTNISSLFNSIATHL